MKYKIFTDGSARRNGKEDAIGAYGFVVLDEEENIKHTMVTVRANATNQQMELMACLSACQYAETIRQPFDDVEIVTDSAYLSNCYNQLWYRKWQNNNWINSKQEPVANKEIWVDLIPFFENINFNIVKTKGHAEDKWNNYVDKLVQGATAQF